MPKMQCASFIVIEDIEVQCDLDEGHYNSSNRLGGSLTRNNTHMHLLVDGAVIHWVAKSKGLKYTLLKRAEIAVVDFRGNDATRIVDA